MLNWIDKLPVKALFVVAVFFAIVPLPEPHLLQKLGMLFEGTLTRPIDIFDLFMHGLPAVLLAVRLIRIQLHK